MKRQLNNKNEKDKLLLDKKKITVRLQEIQLEEQKATMNVRDSNMKIRVKAIDLGLNRVTEIAEKMEKDKNKELDKNNLTMVVDDELISI